MAFKLPVRVGQERFAQLAPASARIVLCQIFLIIPNVRNIHRRFLNCRHHLSLLQIIRNFDIHAVIHHILIILGTRRGCLSCPGKSC